MATAFDDQNEKIGSESAEYETAEGHKSGIVAVVGRPNVGKSTLVNAFLRQKIAIVTPRPQTTRTRQLGIITAEDYQIIVADTPGMMSPRHKLDEYMMETAVEALKDADVVLWLVDASDEPGPGDQLIADQLETLADEVAIILAINKADLLAPDEVLPRTEAYRALLPDAEWLLFSATEGDGREKLLQMLVDALPLGPRLYPADQITDVYTRDIAAELIREQIMLRLRDEIPYGVAVKVDDFKERSKNLIYIHATIHVERAAHKQIVIGAKGSMLRKLGTSARKEIEALVERKVYLELWVKVEPNWRRNAKALKRLGYAPQ
jgi:GTP-binding protein Era